MLASGLYIMWARYMICIGFRLLNFTSSFHCSFYFSQKIEINFIKRSEINSKLLEFVSMTAIFAFQRREG